MEDTKHMSQPPQAACVSRLIPTSIVQPDSEESHETTRPDKKTDESSLLPWICVLGASLFLMTSFGFMQSVGTIQSYLPLHQLSAYSARDVGWITGMYQFLALLLGIQTGPLMDHYGPRLLGPLATGLVVLMFFLMAECKEYWHFMLCLGLLGGLGAAVASNTAISSISKLFFRRRGLAMGVAFVGSSIGGIIFPVILRQTLSSLGWQWSCRVLGFFVLGVMVTGCICLLPFPQLTSCLEVPPDRREKSSAAVNFVAFRSKPFTFITVGFFLLEFAISGISGLLPTLAIAAGFTSDTGYTLIAILNGCSCLGRVLPGLAGDRVGHFDVLLLMIIVTLSFTGAMLVPPFGSNSAKVLFAFAALWGFGSGSFVSMTPVCLSKTCDPKDVGRYYGTMTFIVSFGALISIPLGGEMLEMMGSIAMSSLFLAAVFLGGVCFYVARSILVRKAFVILTNI